jgi:hypothetical protein
MTSNTILKRADWKKETQKHENYRYAENEDYVWLKTNNSLYLKAGLKDPRANFLKSFNNEDELLDDLEASLRDLSN